LKLQWKHAFGNNLCMRSWIPEYLYQSDGKKMLIDFTIYISLNVENTAPVLVAI